MPQQVPKIYGYYTTIKRKFHNYNKDFTLEPKWGKPISNGA